MSDSLPKTAYVKMVDIWLIFAQLVPWIEVFLFMLLMKAIVTHTPGALSIWVLKINQGATAHCNGPDEDRGGGRGRGGGEQGKGGEQPTKQKTNKQPNKQTNKSKGREVNNHRKKRKLINNKGAGLFQRAGQTMKQAGERGTSRYLIGIKS